MKSYFTTVLLSSLSSVEPANVFAPRSYHESNDDWVQVFGMGLEVREGTDITMWASGSSYIPDNGGFYIKRICVDCIDDHKQIIYKRLTSLPDDFNIPSLFLETWSSVNNVLNEDFALYSNMLDALDDTARWTFCNYDEPGLGFPRDCGPDGFIGNQWTSLTWGGKQNYAYYVWEGNLNGASSPAPGPINANTLDNWTQVFGRGSEVSGIEEPSLWAPNALSGTFYVRRICRSCRPSHKDIIYKRLTALPHDFDVENLFVGTWSSENNMMDIDFELYPKMSYALAGILTWDFCNYDDNNIGFPLDCGQSGFFGGQWNSLTRGGQADYAYYVWNENPVNENPEWVSIYTDDFELDQGIFKGNNIRFDDLSFPGGDWSLRLKKTSKITTKKIDVNSYSEIFLSFKLYCIEMEDEDTFNLNYKFFGDPSWSPVEEWTIGTGCNNGAWVEKIVNINISEEKKIRFQFQSRSDQKSAVVYIDNVLLKGKPL